MPINSRAKGKRGELEAVKYLKSLGFADAKRSQQYNGIGKGDVICPESLPGVHIEVKFGYPRNQLDVGLATFREACEQAERDSGDPRRWAVLWKQKGGRQWKITYRSDAIQVGTTPTLSFDNLIAATLRYLRDRETP